MSRKPLQRSAANQSFACDFRRGIKNMRAAGAAAAHGSHLGRQSAVDAPLIERPPAIRGPSGRRFGRVASRDGAICRRRGGAQIAPALPSHIVRPRGNGCF